MNVPWESSYFTVSTFAVAKSIGLPLGQDDRFKPTLQRIKQYRVHTVFPHRNVEHQSTHTHHNSITMQVSIIEGYETVQVQPTCTCTCTCHCVSDCLHTPTKGGSTHAEVVKSKGKAGCTSKEVLATINMVYVAAKVFRFRLHVHVTVSFHLQLLHVFAYTHENGDFISMKKWQSKPLYWWVRLVCLHLCPHQTL